MAIKMTAAGFVILAYLATLNSAKVAGVPPRPNFCPPGASWKSEYPYNCATYFHCSNGTASIELCPIPTVFNPAKSKCDWSDNVPNCATGGFIDLPK